MLEFFKFLVLMFLDIILSITGAYIVFEILAEDVGTGTGAIGDAMMVWLIAIVSFVVMVVAIGALLYWLMFILNISIWYFIIVPGVLILGLLLFLIRHEILQYFQTIFR